MKLYTIPYTNVVKEKKSKNKLLDITVEELRQNLKKYFGFDNFRGFQLDAIKSLLNGHHTFLIMPTGGGKSLCYQLPALLCEGTAIVVSPLIALMKNQVDILRLTGIDPSMAHYWNSTLRAKQIREIREDMLNGKTKILYLAPETLAKQELQEFLHGLKISFVAVDEAHCISEWGHDFRPEYRNIRKMVDAINKNLPIIALTATATPLVREDIIKNLGIQNCNIFIASFNRPNLYYEVRAKIDPITQIIKYIKKNPGKSGLIYCATRKSVVQLARILNANGIKALPYHAGLPPSKRHEYQDKFLNDKVQVMVATIAFGMGIDKMDIRFVIHYHIAKSLESYYQETGRAGRDGGEGNCILFYSDKDLEIIHSHIQEYSPSQQEVSFFLIDEIISYVQTASCRRKHFLNYFGEHYPFDNCQNCDNCINPPQKYEATKEMAFLLQTIQLTKGKFDSDHISKILKGIESPEIVSFNHHKLPVFGSCANRSQQFIEALVREAIIQQFIIRDIKSYGNLKLTPLADKFLNNPTHIYIAEIRTFEQTDDDIQAIRKLIVKPEIVPIDETLYSILKKVVREIANEENVPPFTIASDLSLKEMATYFPTTPEELLKITGFGELKVKKFGHKFINAIEKYLMENDVAKPLIPNTPKPNKQNIHTETLIISAIDRRLPLQNIASDLKLTLSQLYEKIESIILKGIRLNLDPYIKELLYLSDSQLDNLKNNLLTQLQSNNWENPEEIISSLNGHISPEDTYFIKIWLLSKIS